MADGLTMRTLRTCIQCGKPIVAGMKECFSCGAPVNEEKKPDEHQMRCSTCGKELVRGAIVCSLCGTRLQPERPVATASPPVSPSHPTPVLLTTREPSSSFPSLTKGPLFGITKRMGLRLGALVFLLFGFFAGKMLFRNLPAKLPPGELSLLPPATEQVVAPPPATSVTEPLSTPVLPKGRVVTADGLTNIRIFGPGANDPKRTAAVLRERVEEFLPSIQSVYSDRLTTTRQLLGTVVLELAVTPEGRVDQVEVHTTGLENPEFLQIVQLLVEEWQFEATAAGTTTIFYPLLFTPTEIDPLSLIELTKELLPGRYRMVRGEPTPVRLRPTDGVQEVGRVSPGLRIDVVGSQKGWLAVLSPKGKVGYVRRDAILPRVGDEQPVS